MTVSFSFHFPRICHHLTLIIFYWDLEWTVTRVMTHGKSGEILKPKLLQISTGFHHLYIRISKSPTRNFIQSPILSYDQMICLRIVACIHHSSFSLAPFKTKYPNYRHVHTSGDHWSFISNDFSSKKTGPIVIKFHKEQPGLARNE